MSFFIKTLRLNEGVLIGLVAIVVVALEVVSARLAYETLGAGASTLYGLATAINLPFILLAFRRRLLAIAGIVLLALVIVPYQFVLAERLWRVQTEAARIVAYAYETRVSASAYPTSLADYSFYDSTTEPFVKEYGLDAAAGGFILCYSVGTESTSHCYSPKNGWTYYAD